MSNGIEFDGDNTQYAMRRSTPNMSVGSSNEPKMVQWLMKKGIVKSPNVGQIVLVGIVIINVIITFAVITYLL